MPSVRGVPFSRTYSLEDIGHIPRGSRLGFDQVGRLTIVHETVYTVLNDSNWLSLAGEDIIDRVPLICVVQGPDGHNYYGARGSWGYTELGADGRIHPVPLVPPNPPAWIATASFSDVLITKRGLYFPSWNGVVYWDFEKKTNLLFEVPRLSSAFLVGDRVYISAFEKPLRYIDLTSQTLKSAAGTALDDNVVELSTPLDDSRSLVTFTDGRLLVYDGKTVSPWLAPEDNSVKGHISAIQQMVDGRIAIAVTGQGLLLFSKEGQLLMALTAAQYHNISALANREPGVLWIETEDTIEKILYSSPLSAFKQRLGLPIAWPIIVSCNGQLYVASSGKLYRAANGSRAEPTRFELCARQPPGGAWALAAWGQHMIVGNGTGLYWVDVDGGYHPIKSVGNLGSLVMYDENHCYLIGRSEIALIEWKDGQWQEFVPRIPGVANPAILHRVHESVWIEMGGGGIAHLRLNQNKLQLDIIPNEPWTKASWVNVGVVGDIVILSARMNEPRRYYNEKLGDWCSAPELERLLNRSPYWILRPFKDEAGVIWGCHDEGLVRFAPHGGDYDMDASSFDLVNDRYPTVRELPQNDIWVVAARAMYHLEKDWISSSEPTPRPILVSLFDSQHNEELLAPASVHPNVARQQYSYTKNNLSFRFFSGTDAWRRAPSYEYRLNSREAWSTLDGSLLNFRGLREGKYELQVRVTAALNPSEATSTIAFEILPPWHRTWPAYVLFGLLSVAVLLGVARWTTFLERHRNRKLAGLVAERTHQLEDAMAQLGDETRKAATLAERDRLANEIHDSVQQGLTGAILQLDTTLKLPVIDEDVRSRLDVVRNMVSYARQEVQHAVWDMESPLLEGVALGDALRNLTTFVDSAGAVEVSVTGEPRPLGRAINHNLLRVAQEAATNAFRHAHAKRIEIRLSYTPTEVTLEIADDGVGFILDEVLHEKVGHLGLRGIQARAKKLQGALTIKSAADHGTVVRIVVPVANNFEPS